MNYLREDIHHLGLLRTIKFAYQRVVRGYDERIYWELDGYFDQFVKPIKEFCEREVQKESLTGNALNEERDKIFKKTLKLISDYETGVEDFYVSGTSTKKLWSYVGKHITWYWD